MNKGCAEYRRLMELLELQLQLEKADVDTRTKHEVEERIKMLRKELDLD